VSDPLRQLAAQVRVELKDVQRVLRRIKEGWRRAHHSTDDYYLDGVALNLHGFYGGLERLFERIAVVVDAVKLEPLVVEAAVCFPQVQAELLAFADLLDRQAARRER